VANTISDILGGIRSTCTYVGASKLKELSRRTTFIRVSQQLNEVFGSKDESKHPVFAAIPDHSAAAAEPVVEGPEGKKARTD
jgi:hypothetical protein